MWEKAHRKRSSGSGGITVVRCATRWSRSNTLSPCGGDRPAPAGRTVQHAWQQAVCPRKKKKKAPGAKQRWRLRQAHLAGFEAGVQLQVHAGKVHLAQRHAARTAGRGTGGQDVAAGDRGSRRSQGWMREEREAGRRRQSKGRPNFLQDSSARPSARYPPVGACRQQPLVQLLRQRLPTLVVLGKAVERLAVVAPVLHELRQDDHSRCI